MDNISGKLFQKTLSKSLQNKWQLELAEVIFLFLLGMLAITLHARMRIPLQLPGKFGLVFMLLLVSGRLVSHYRFATSVSCLGASGMLMFNFLGFDDPYMSFIYLLMGFIMDVLFKLAEKSKYNYYFVILAGGLSWACIPILRLILAGFFSFHYHSLSNGLLYPLTTHFVFGVAGSALAVLIFNKALKQ